MTRPYADAAALYWQAGWRGVLPLPAGAKTPVPVGYTGHDGLDVSYPDLHAWTEDQPAGNIGLRLPDSVLGIDVDGYDGKVGGATFERYQAIHGALPPTWQSTSRDDGVSAIRFFRVPGGQAWQTYLTGGGVEIIQRTHRYAVVWPSVHPEGRTYRWLRPDGTASDQLPTLDELSELPESWQQALTKGAYQDRQRVELDSGQARDWLAALPEGEPCPWVLRRQAAVLAAMGGNSRHDATVPAVLALLYAGAGGHPGVRATIDSLGMAFTGKVGPSRPSVADAGREWARLVQGGIARVLADPSTGQHGCRCTPLTGPQAADPATTTGKAVAGLTDMSLHLDEANLADRVARDVLAGRYVWTVGLDWLRWDGKRWADITEASVIEVVRRFFIQEYARALRQNAPKEVQAAWQKLLTRSHIANVVLLARGIMLTDIGLFDQHPDLLNVANGVVDLRNGKLEPHDPALLLTKLAPVEFLPDAGHVDWDAALGSLPDDVRGWFQVRIGQSATGFTPPDDVMPICQGGGENGKSLILGSVQRALGEFAVFISDRVLMATEGSHPTELMDLRGARFALIEETPDARRLNTARLKRVVGTGTINARRMYRDPVPFEPTHSLFLTSNYRMQIDETDEGTWRRMMLVVFPYRYRKPGDEIRADYERTGDSGLPRRLTGRAQQEAVLRWIVDGAVAWYAMDRQMPPLPERVKRDTLEWRGETDHILGYIKQHLVFERGRYITTTGMLGHFNRWRSSNGQQEWGDQTLTERFGSHGEALAAGVVKRRQGRLGPELDTPPGDFKSPPSGRAMVWAGVRYRCELDDRNDLRADSGITGLVADPEADSDGQVEMGQGWT